MLDSGVVDEDVDVTDLLGERRVRECGRVGEVDGPRRAANLLRQSLGACGIAIRHGDIGATGREIAHHRGADAGRAPGNEGAAATERQGALRGGHDRAPDEAVDVLVADPAEGSSNRRASSASIARSEAPFVSRSVITAISVTMQAATM